MSTTTRSTYTHTPHENTTTSLSGIWIVKSVSWWATQWTKSYDIIPKSHLKFINFIVLCVCAFCIFIHNIVRLCVGIPSTIRRYNVASTNYIRLCDCWPFAIPLILLLANCVAKIVIYKLPGPRHAVDKNMMINMCKRFIHRPSLSRQQSRARKGHRRNSKRRWTQICISQWNWSEEM